MAAMHTPVYMKETSNSLIWTRSCDKETIKPVEGKVQGELPAWLSGRLIRNGPGKTGFGDTQFNHLFDMSALIHQFTIKDGTVTYQSRYLQGDTYKRNLKANRIVVGEFGTAAHPDPCMTLFQRFKTFFKPLAKMDTDNCLVSVCHFGDQLYALTETSIMRRIDPETLDTVGAKTQLQDYIAVNTATAHPHVDPDGTVYNMGSSFAGREGPHYCIIKFPPPAVINGKKISSLEQATLVTKIPCQWKMYPSYYHSFAITDNYFIFVEQPFVLDLKKFLINAFLFTGKSFLGAMKWCGKEKTRFHVIRRDTGQLLSTTYLTDAFMTFHHTNAYEEDGHLVVDLCALKSGEVISQFMLYNLSNADYKATPESLPYHQRYVLPLRTEGAAMATNLVTLKNTKCTAHKLKDGTISVQGQVISHNIFDLPRINYAYNGKPYNFAYGVEVNPLGLQFSRLVKINVQSGEAQRWHEEGRVVSEPVFVATPQATCEDDGIVLTTLLDKTDPTFVALLVVDAATWREVARVTFRARGKVTSTFHGQFAATGNAVHLL